MTIRCWSSGHLGKEDLLPGLPMSARIGARRNSSIGLATAKFGPASYNGFARQIANRRKRREIEQKVAKEAKICGRRIWAVGRLGDADAMVGTRSRAIRSRTSDGSHPVQRL